MTQASLLVNKHPTFGTKRIGVIGFGKWGQNIIRTLAELEVLAGAAEIDDGRRRELEEQYPEVPIFNSIEALLYEDISAIVVATPASTHYEVAKAALLANKDVFVEKPLTLHPAHAKELVEIARDRSLILMVGHMLLYQTAIQFLKKELDSRHLGHIYSLHSRRRNLGTVRKAENALLSLGTHDIAVICHLVNQPVTNLTAVGHTALQKDIEDDVHLHLEYADGAHAHLHTSWQWPVKDRGLTILCKYGAYVYDEALQTIAKIESYARPDGSLHIGEEEVIFRGSANPLRLEFEHFIKCLETRSKPMSSGEQGLEVVEIIDKAMRQLRSTKYRRHDG